jgi:hypothetical protein
MALKTKISFDLGTIAHLIFGFLAVFLHYEFLFTLTFIFKQVIDVYGGEDVEKTSGDIVEYCIGLVAGAIVLRLLS